MRLCLFSIAIGLLSGLSASAEPWVRHTIDDSSRGADGVRLADVNGDGRLDVLTGWEEGGLVRVCLQPEASQSRGRWPSVTVGLVPSPEDAFAADLDGDGHLDIISCHEGREQSVCVAWNTAETPLRFLPSQPIPATKGITRWMYGFAEQLDDRNGIDLVIGSKRVGSDLGMVGWVKAPPNPRNLDDWTLHQIVPAGWTMSLEPFDVDGDGRLDILVTDRKGQRRGLYALLRRGTDAEPRWKRCDIGLANREVMFIDVSVTPEAGTTIWVATRNVELAALTQSGDSWIDQRLPNPNGITTGKAVAVTPVPSGAKVAYLVNTRAAGRPDTTAGVFVAELSFDPVTRQWSQPDWSPISGPAGVKFDRAEWIDLDADGDLDLLACEERDNLGVFWYEQP